MNIRKPTPNNSGAIATVVAASNPLPVLEVVAVVVLEPVAGAALQGGDQLPLIVVLSTESVLCW